MSQIYVAEAAKNNFNKNIRDNEALSFKDSTLFLNDIENVKSSFDDLIIKIDTMTENLGKIKYDHDDFKNTEVALNSLIDLIKEDTIKIEESTNSIYNSSKEVFDETKKAYDILLTVNTTNIEAMDDDVEIYQRINKNLEKLRGRLRTASPEESKGLEESKAALEDKQRTCLKKLTEDIRLVEMANKNMLAILDNGLRKKNS